MPRAFGRLDEGIGEQRENGEENLFAGGLGAQDTSRLLHLAALLTTAMPGARECILFDLLPGDAGPITGKGIQSGPEILDELIDRGTARIQQAQGLRLLAVWQADGKREHLRLDHLRAPVLPDRRSALRSVFRLVATTARSALLIILERLFQKT
jgi:hypothetical protein